MGFTQLNPATDPDDGQLFSGLYGGADTMVYFNKEGKRYVNEYSERDVLSAAALEQTDGPFFIVCDQKVADNPGVPQMADTKGNEAKGDLYIADTLEELAQKMGVPVETFVAEVERYNAPVVGLLILGHLRIFMNQDFNPPINRVLLRLQTLHLLFKGTRIIQCSQRLRAGFNDFPFLLDHLVDRFQKSILQFCLPKMWRRTRGPLRLVLPVAAPCPRTIGICTVPDLAAIISAAFPAHNSIGEYTDRTGMSALLPATPQFVLDKVRYFLRDNRRMLPSNA